MLHDRVDYCIFFLTLLLSPILNSVHLFWVVIRYILHWWIFIMVGHSGNVGFYRFVDVSLDLVMLSNHVYLIIGILWYVLNHRFKELATLICHSLPHYFWLLSLYYMCLINYNLFITKTSCMNKILFSWVFIFRWLTVIILILLFQSLIL